MTDSKTRLSEDDSSVSSKEKFDLSMLKFRRGRRLPSLLQSESTECGLTCIAMMLGYYGNHAPLNDLRQRFPNSAKGMTARRMMEVAASMGVQSRALKLEMTEMRQLQTPCVLHWDLDHFVVLKSAGKSGIVIHDPAIGVRKLSLDQASKHFTGIAVEFSPGPELKQQREFRRVSLRSLAGSVRGLRKSMVQIFGLAWVLEIFALIAPLFMQMVVDQVLADGDRDLLAFLGLSFGLLIILETLVSTLRSWTVMWINTHFHMGWTGNVFHHLMRLPLSYFSSRHVGDVVSKFGAIDSIQQTLTTRFVEVVLDGVMASVTLFVMFIYSTTLASVSIVALLIYLILRLLYFHVYREANLGQITVNARQQSRFLESIRGIQTIRLNNQGPLQVSRYLNVTADSLNMSIAVQRLDMLFTALQSLANGGQRLGVLWLGAWLGLKGQMTVGMLTAFLAYSDQFSGRAASFVDYMVELRMLRLQAERLADIMMTNQEPYAEGNHVGPMPSPSIEFRNVSFRYSGDQPWILRNCSFSVAEGESIAITGPSGSGKSTLVRLLLGLLDPDEGVIEIGGMDIRRLGKSNYRSMTGSVMQDDHLFSGSIADNVSLFDVEASQERIESACRISGIHDDVMAMAMGYHSPVGDMGSSLSGGQQQRIYMARALYRQPKILVLDEATSHLDTLMEGSINRAISSMNMTRIFIAHRLETIAVADRVVEVRNGATFELGPSSPRNYPDSFVGNTAPLTRDI